MMSTGKLNTKTEIKSRLTSVSSIITVKKRKKERNEKEKLHQ